ncbi:MAG: DNA recombination protein RmuC [Paludibacteraceae bacterium]|nr:DNA recombination protein RmuC [Paludibacteraceae bacterium]
MVDWVILLLCAILGLAVGALIVFWLERTKLTSLERRNALLESENNHLTAQVGSQQEQLEALQQRLTSEFENIANRVLKSRSEEFSQSNERQIGTLLKPLQTEIDNFKRQVSEAYGKEMREKIQLGEQLKHLLALNQQVSADAQNLARALKGESKTQGNWGEMVLERLLEMSGLQEGAHFSREQVLQSGEGRTLRPDVILQLPDNKHLVIDSKVSLTAYERYVAATEDDVRAVALKSHLDSINKHVSELSGKNYANLYGIDSPDFVLMFIPVEASFTLAMQADGSIFEKALQKNVVIVCPTTLLATLRTVASVWKHENQTRNAIEIAQKSGQLYDKLVGFVDDMDRIKASLNNAQKAYTDAYNKLSDGRGSALTTARKIKELGAKTTKSLPED